MNARTAGALASLALTLAGLALTLGALPADGATVLLKNTWLKQHKNRVTVSASCRIDKSHAHPNGIAADGDDGDLHMACRCATVGLPMVGEIVNAAQFDDAVQVAKDAAKNHTMTQVEGVWRFWLEHPSAKPQTQGAAVPVPGNTNPDHSFELHPLTSIGGEDLSGSFSGIPGYHPYAAKTAFAHYEGRTFTVSRSGAFTSIVGTKAKYNYAGFTFEVAGKPKHVADGWFVLATIAGVNGDPRRMVIADGTAAAALIASATKGKRFKAVGIPRINLERIDELLMQHPHETLPITGAYEMIVVSMTSAP